MAEVLHSHIAATWLVCKAVRVVTLQDRPCWRSPHKAGSRAADQCNAIASK